MARRSGFGCVTIAFSPAAKPMLGAIYLYAAVLAAWPHDARAQTANVDADAGAEEPPPPPPPPPPLGTPIDITPGTIQGVVVGTTREFLGIPYAEPPVGERRFKPAQPVAAWCEPRLTTALAASCPQPASPLSLQGPSSEDCLYMNVYAPRDGCERLPVMVYIHGGAFMRGGAAAFDGRALSEAGHVIVVTFNYRLGPLGFLSHPALDKERGWPRSGNDGIRDQQLALQFLRDNVAAFGGDPSNITVFGESAGSVSTCLHYVWPTSRVLAQRFLLESGTCVGGGYGTTNKAAADAKGQQLAEELCAGQPDVLACLRQLPPETLVNWQATRQPFGANWTPAVDHDGGLLPDIPEEVLRARRHDRGELLLGSNKNEWQLYVLLQQLQITTNAVLDAMLDQQFGADAAKVKQQYTSPDDSQASATYVRLMTDISFRCPTRKLARLATDSHSDVYLYSFEAGTAAHGAELDYVFARGAAAPQLPEQPIATANLRTLIQGYWTQFAADGDPNGGDRPDWPCYQNATEPLMTLADPAHVATDASSADCTFWEQFVADGGVIQLGF